MLNAQDRSAGRPTVLVVDDDRAIRDSVCEVLEDAGYSVLLAEHGIDALSVLARVPTPSVILLDLLMPSMSGWRFAQELSRRANLADIPVIVMTAAGRYWGTPVSEDRVLRKPFESDQLLNLLERVVSSSC